MDGRISITGLDIQIVRTNPIQSTIHLQSQVGILITFHSLLKLEEGMMVQQWNKLP